MTVLPHPDDFAAGCIYFISDHRLRLPGEGDREFHTERRLVLIVSDRDSMHGKNRDRSWPSVLVIPISSETKRRTEFDVKFAAGEGGMKKKGWARIPAVQLVDKDWLEDMTGCVGHEKLEIVYARIFQYLGLTD